MSTASASLGSRCFTVKANHPKPGVTFYDMAPLLAVPALRRSVIAQLGKRTEGLGVTHILAIETRGFWVGSWIAEQLGVPVIALRKKSNALKAHAAADLVTMDYGLEYGSDEVALPRGCIPEGARVLLADDVFATGGTLVTAALLCKSVQPDCTVVGTAVLLELLACKGKAAFLARTNLDVEHVSLFCIPVDGGEAIYDVPHVTEARPAVAAAVHPDDERAVLMWHPSMESVAQELLYTQRHRLRASPVKWEAFPDGWPNVHFEHRRTLQGKSVVFLASFHDKNLIMEQISLMIALPRQVIKSLQVFVPYFGPGTMERVSVEGELATAETLAKMCTTCLPSTRSGPPVLTFFDVHALCERFYFDDRATVVFESAIALIKERILAQRMTVVFPDEGAFKRFYPEFKDTCPIVVCSKTRGKGDERKVIIAQEFLSHAYGPGIDPWKQPAIIIDDLVQSGSTLAECAVALRTNYAFASISAYVTHAVFPNNAHLRFATGPGRKTFDTFYVTNTNPSTSLKLEKIGAPFVVLDIAPLLETILEHRLPECIPPLVESANILNVIACTQSQLKVEAMYDALASIGKRAHDGIRRSILITAVAQPIGNQEIYNCMLERIESTVNATRLMNEDELYISIESGIVPDPVADGADGWREVTCIGLFKRARAESRVNHSNVVTKWVSGPALDPKSPEFKDLLPKVFAAKGSVTLGSLLHEHDPSIPADAWYNRKELITRTLAEMLA